MGGLIKIREVTKRYGITARTLRYYENIGLLDCVRKDTSGYRMYDTSSVKRIEQILVLRKLNISIKDIKRIFNTSGSEVVLDILGKKVENIDNEVSLLQELKIIVIDFIKEFETMSFNNSSDVKQLYEKAKEIETQIINVDYNGKTSNINRLLEVTNSLEKKIPDVMVVRVPPFKAITSKEQSWVDIFSNGGYMMKLWKNYHLFKPVIFDCLDFTLSKGDKAEMICALKDGVKDSDVAPFEIVDFPGGLYAMAVSIDEDIESIKKVEEKICKWIDNTNFERDEERHFMFNMPYLDEDNQYNQDILKGLGYRQMQRYVPIKLNEQIGG